MTINGLRVRRLALLALVGAGGCDSRANGPETFPVAGTVTFDGQPVAGADVAFLPSRNASDAAPAQATTDEAGRFEVVSLFDQGRTSQAGMRPGKYSIQVTHLKQPPAGAGLSQSPKNTLPEKYASAASSGLSVEVVPEGKNDFAIELTK
jgi:hypothetical protein